MLWVLNWSLFGWHVNFSGANSLCPFWDDGEVTLSKANRDLQLGDKKVTLHHLGAKPLIFPRCAVNRLIGPLSFCVSTWICSFCWWFFEWKPWRKKKHTPPKFKHSPWNGTIVRDKDRLPIIIFKGQSVKLRGCTPLKINGRNLKNGSFSMDVGMIFRWTSRSFVGGTPSPLSTTIWQLFLKITPKNQGLIKMVSFRMAMLVYRIVDESSWCFFL